MAEKKEKVMLKKQNSALIGLVISFFPMLAFCSLSLLALTNRIVSSMIAVDKLILLTIALSPVVYGIGAVVSVTALAKSEMKITAFVGAAANIVMLIFLFYFRKSFLMEFELMM